MEDYLQYKTFRIKEKLTEEVANALTLLSKTTAGIDKIKCAGQIVSFIYNPYSISENEIIKWLLSVNLTIKQPNPKSFKGKLEKLAKENKENFGGRRLDCCDLNN